MPEHIYSLDEIFAAVLPLLKNISGKGNPDLGPMPDRRLTPLLILTCSLLGAKILI